MKSLMKKKHVLLSLIFGICLAWFFATVFIDFIAVPNVFRTVSSLKEAGTLGGIIFTSFNIIEMIFAVLIIVLSTLYKKKGSKATIVLKILAASTFVLAIVYTTTLSPGIRDTNIAKSNYTHTDEEYQVLEEKLRTYHSLYVKLDSYKLLALLTMCGITLTGLVRLETKEGEA